MTLAMIMRSSSSRSSFNCRNRSSLRQRTYRRHLSDLRNHLGAEALDRLQGKFRIHARPIDHKPHDLGVELAMILHHLVDDFGRAAENKPVALQLVKCEIIAFARLAPLL